MEDTVNTIIENSSLPKLKILRVSSDGGVTKNMTIYECGNDILIVDCGIGFPDSELLGVDVVIPDVSYLVERKHRIRGLFITHAHEDHIGAIPYVIEDLGCPIYTNKLVQEFIKGKLKDKYQGDNLAGVSLNNIDPDSGEVRLGNFTVSAIHINHSVPSGMGFAIRTPQGLVLHMADYKIDWTPILDKPIELGKVAGFGNSGVLCLLSDCLGVTNDTYAKSERSLDGTFGPLFEKAEGRQIFVTMISSNISRMYQVIKAAIQNGRKVVFSGRSVEQNGRIARSLGYLPFDESVFVEEKSASNMNQSKLVYIIAGCFGQSGSGLDRLSHGEHSHITLDNNEPMVVFSADPNPPGVQEAVEKLLHNLTVAGCEVIYSEIYHNLHVSGHGLRGDLMTVTALAKPKYCIPIGGNAAKMRAFTHMVAELGIEKERVFELLDGETLEFDNGIATKGSPVVLDPIYLSGKNQSQLNPIVVKDRGQLSEEGLLVVVIPITKEGKLLTDKVEIVTRGFIYVKGSQELMDKSRKFITDRLNKIINKEKDIDLGGIKKKLERELDHMLYKELGRSPLIIVHHIQI